MTLSSIFFLYKRVKLRPSPVEKLDDIDFSCDVQYILEVYECKISQDLDQNIGIDPGRSVLMLRPGVRLRFELAFMARWYLCQVALQIYCSLVWHVIYVMKIYQLIHNMLIVVDFFYLLFEFV